MARHPAAKRAAGGGYHREPAAVPGPVVEHAREEPDVAAEAVRVDQVDDATGVAAPGDAAPDSEELPVAVEPDVAALPLDDDVAAAADQDADPAEAVDLAAASNGSERPLASVSAPLREEHFGLQALIGTLEAAIAELDTALADGGGVRSTMTALASGVPGDDRDVVGFIRRELAPVQDRMLTVLAGLSEERRAVDSIRAELDRIRRRPTYDVSIGLARVAATTGAVRGTPVASLPEPPARREDNAPPPAANAGGDAGPVARPDTSVQPVERAAASPWSEPLGPSGTAVAGSAGSAGSAVARFAGALRRTAGHALGVEQPATDRSRRVLHEEPTSDAGSPARGDDETASGSAATTAAHGHLHAIGEAAPKPLRRTARYAFMIGVPALVFSGIGGVPPRVDAVPRPLSSLAASIATAMPVPTEDPNAVLGPGVIPLGDDAANLDPAVPALDNATGPGADRFAPATADPGVAAPDLTPIVTFRGPRGSKVVALTFDDGYSAANIRRILTTLERNKVTATFFVNGIYLSRAPAVWKEVAAAGFPVGNHTYHHVDIRTLSAADIERELQMTAAAWKRTTGTDLIPYFRPPYGAHNAASDARVAAAGYADIVLWSNSAVDSTLGTTVAQAEASALKGGPGAIVLMHAGPDITPRILQAVIDGYRARGFSFVTIPQLLGG